MRVRMDCKVGQARLPILLCSAHSQADRFLRSTTEPCQQSPLCSLANGHSETPCEISINLKILSNILLVLQALSPDLRPSLKTIAMNLCPVYGYVSALALTC